MSHRGISLAGPVLSFFLLAAGIIVVAQLFHASLRRNSDSAQQARACLIAAARLAEVREWAAATGAGGYNYDNWGPYTNVASNDPNEPMFVVTVRSAAHTVVNLGNTLTDAINLSRDNLEICASVSVPGGSVIQAGDRLIRQPIAGGAASFINPTPLVHNGHYTKDGLRLYCSAEQGGNWAVYRCNVDGSAGSLLLPGCKLFGIK